MFPGYIQVRHLPLKHAYEFNINIIKSQSEIWLISQINKWQRNAVKYLKQFHNRFSRHKVNINWIILTWVINWIFSVFLPLPWQQYGHHWVCRWFALTLCINKRNLIFNWKLTDLLLLNLNVLQVRARRKVAVTVLAFVVIFGICFLPYHVFFLWFYYW